MFTSFDENAFWKAIAEKDMLHLKVNTVSAIRNDPTFERGETTKVLNILEEKVPEIFEPEVRLEYEERLDRDKWNKGYFTKLTYWFQENFAKSRINYIKEVGQTVHKDTAKKYSASMSMNNLTDQNPIHAPEKKRKLPLWGAIAAAAALVLLVMLLSQAVHKVTQAKTSGTSQTKQLQTQNKRDIQSITSLQQRSNELLGMSRANPHRKGN